MCIRDRAHSDYRIAQSNPNVGRYAPLELKQAGDALAQADALATEHASSEKIDQLAYLARQKIALTEEVAKQKMAETDVRNAGQERNQVRLDQRTNEANAANIRAEQARQVALLAINDAAQSRLTPTAPGSKPRRPRRMPPMPSSAPPN